MRSSRDSTASTASSSSRDSISSSVGRPAYVPVPWDEGEVVLDEKGSPKLLSESSKRALYSEIEAALRGRDPRTSAELSGTERTYIHPHQGHLGIYLRDSGGSIVNGPYS